MPDATSFPAGAYQGAMYYNPATGKIEQNVSADPGAPSWETANSVNDLSPTGKPYTEADAQAAADAQEKAATLFGIDNGITSAQGGLDRLGNQRNIGAGNISREYQAAADMLLGKRNLADQQYGQNTTTQLNEFQQARNRSGERARSFLEGGRRTLGANGAGGGSADRFALPFEAAEMAASGNSEAQSTNNKNIISITQGYDKDKQAIDNENKRIASQRDQGVRDLDGRIEGKRAELLQTIAQLTGQKNIVNGGNIKSAQAAANPYLTQIPGILNNLDTLSSTVPIAAQDISLSRPDLSGYNFAQPGAAPTAVQDPTLGVNPILAMLGIDDKNKQLI